jgi:hypothetical protein
MPAVLPDYTVLPEEKMRAFPKGKRFEGVCSITEYLDRRAAELKKSAAGTVDELREVLRVCDETIRRATLLSKEDGWEKYTIETSRGRMLPFLVRRGKTAEWRVLASPGAKSALESSGLLADAMKSKDSLLIFDPWGCGESGYAEEMFPIHFKQHQLARSLMWLGRRLMGEWTMDFLRAAEFIRDLDSKAALHLCGHHDSGLAALFSTVLAPKNIKSVDLVDSPVCLIRKEHQLQEEIMNMGLCIPGILQWGDVEHAISLTKCTVNVIRPKRADGTLLPQFPQTME